MSEHAAISSVDGCVRTYSKTSSDIEEIITKCIGIAEDLSELDEQEREIASLRDSLLSIVRSDIQLNQMSKATEQCKNAMRNFYRSNNTGEETVPDLAKLYDDELQKIVAQSNDNQESHQALKDFDNMNKTEQPTSIRANQEAVQQPMDDTGLIFSQVEEALYCPITRKYFEDPVRNKLCNHCYSKAAICQMLTRKSSVKCPVGGCTKPVMLPNLIPDKEVARKVKRKIREDKYDKHTSDTAVQL
ncbi:E3 SUMO-protein ligase NSE2-like [Dysidea avara]|uniref:E3 SUMO-protein ligase NSE2-like n=1 Tax=Dysidea avara TaxID=196820 RepID=UPI0033342763